MIHELKTILQNNFWLKDLRDFHYFLGLELTYSSKVLVINKRRYALELIFDVDLRASKFASPLLKLNQKLTTREYDHTLGLNSNDVVCVDIDVCRRLIGQLMYLTMIHPKLPFLSNNLVNLFTILRSLNLMLICGWSDIS